MFLPKGDPLNNYSLPLLISPQDIEAKGIHYSNPPAWLTIGFTASSTA
jgi:hypothetical protein